MICDQCPRSCADAESLSRIRTGNVAFEFPDGVFLAGDDPLDHVFDGDDADDLADVDREDSSGVKPGKIQPMLE